MRYSFSKISSYVIIKNTNFCFFLKSGSPSFNNSKVKLEEKKLFIRQNSWLKKLSKSKSDFASLVYQQFCSYPNKISTVLVVNKRFKLKTICDKKDSFENNVLAYIFTTFKIPISLNEFY